MGLVVLTSAERDEPGRAQALNIDQNYSEPLEETGNGTVYGTIQDGGGNGLVVLTSPVRAEPGGVPTLLSQQSVDKRIRYKNPDLLSPFMPLLWARIRMDPYHFAGSGSDLL